MSNPLTDRPSQEAPAARRRRRARETLRAGVWICAASLLLVLCPLALGRWSVNKYLVAFGLVGMCVGASCLFHGGWDWLRRSRDT